MIIRTLVIFQKKYILDLWSVELKLTAPCLIPVHANAALKFGIDFETEVLFSNEKNPFFFGKVFITLLINH